MVWWLDEVVACSLTLARDSLALLLNLPAT